NTWVVMRPFGYEVGAEGSDDVIEVPVGFQTDFASIPRVFWIFLPKWGTYGNASVIHDWLYWEQSRLRSKADAIFREAMGVLGVRAAVRQVMYWAVRSFGCLAWYRNQADRVAGFDRVLDDVRIRAAARSSRPSTMARLAARAWSKLAKSEREGAP
ncbi:MAG: DUF1353 domain-containing protein, partial [Acidobacteriota bacterium]